MQNKQIRDHNQKALDTWKAAKRKQNEGPAENIASGPQNRSRKHHRRTSIKACAEQAYYQPPRHKSYNRSSSRVTVAPPAEGPRQERILNPNLPSSDRALVCDECHKEGSFLAESCRPRPSYIHGNSCMNCCLRHRICRWYGELEYHNGLVALHEGQKRPNPYLRTMEAIPRTREENRLTRTNYTVIPSANIRWLKKAIVDVRQSLNSFEDLLGSTG